MTRHAVALPEQVLGRSTGERMRLYEQHAPDLAEAAARRALDHGGVAPERVTDLIIVSCTGFSAPGVDALLTERLRLPAGVRRSCIGFMGCFGAINGLRAAVGACAADPDAVALVVCVELCSLHARQSNDDVQGQVAAALFSDGAAAAIVAGESAPGRSGARSIGEIACGGSLLLPQGRDWMSWRITDHGFAMTLARQIPGILRKHLASFAAEHLDGRGSTYIVHPGGPEILKAAEEALRPADPTGFDAARTVLARYGNMSSGTVLFVLEEALSRGDVLPALLIAFGPGLTIEGIPVR